VKKRRGFTLIETLVVMAVLTILLSMGIALVAGMMRLERMTARSMAAHMAVSRLIDQWRDDVHTASELLKSHQTQQAGPSCLILKNGDSIIVYTATAGRIDRVTTGPGPRLERYALPTDSSTARFERRGTTVALVIDDTLRENVNQRSDSVAVLGLDLPARSQP
jgi:prepilin-type N-terminal cleavage/methylation domain-containing protein